MGEGVADESRRLEILEARFNKSEEKVMQLDKSIAVYSAIFERNLQIQEKLAVAIDKLSATISDIQQTIVGVVRDTERNSELHESNAHRIIEVEGSTEKKITEIENKLRTKMDKLDDELKEVDNKGKFDILKFIKDNFFSVTLIGYMIYDAAKSYFMK